jgi:antitoxin ParD1/3/4
MNVSLPGRLKRYVDARVATGVYGSASEFIREAIREKLERDHTRGRTGSSLSDELLRGLKSGKGVPFNDDYIKRKKRALVERMTGSKKSA